MNAEGWPGEGSPAGAGAARGRGGEAAAAWLELVGGEALFAAAPVAMALLDLRGRVLAANPAAGRLLGCPAATLHGLPFAAYTHPADLAAGRRLFAALARGEREGYGREKRYRRRDGRVVRGRAGVALLRDERGAPRCVLGTVVPLPGPGAGEAARRRLARELHDGPLQELTQACVGLDLAALPGVAGRERLVGVRAALAGAIGALRGLCLDERPAPAPGGLVGALEDEAARLRVAYPALEVRLALGPAGPEPPVAVVLALAGVAREALRNAARHARARRVELRCAWEAAGALLEVVDDGVGFVPPACPGDLLAGGHLGLVGMRERAAEVGGTLAVTSAPGGGTTVRAVIPLGVAAASAWTASEEGW